MLAVGQAYIPHMYELREYQIEYRKNFEEYNPVHRVVKALLDNFGSDNVKDVDNVSDFHVVSLHHEVVRV